ncbi:hypothetical protein HPP92_016287 [Vanilla planifolia]|uniref:EamA domain-containing protein n=1 Tax=Vanilla planifolia TaxID=51239 RepID=A0A835QKX2_VANPL|nr:hypothetical protein HPP92_016287 [Vanilla planifolia]
MASSSTFSWKWPPTTEASRPSLTISTFPSSSFFFHDSNRPFAAARRLRRLSSRDSPPSVENKNADLVIQSQEGGEKGWSQGARFSGEMAEADHVVEGTESIAPQRRMVKDIFLRDLFRRRPLWKRIVFASKKVRSIMLLNVITVIYASDIPVLKEVEQIVDPAVFTVVRFSITVLPFLPFMLKPDVNSNVRSTGIELGLWISLGYLCQALGLLTSEAGRASFISAFTIILVPLIDGMFGATIPTITWSGALLSFVGVAMMEYGGSPNVGDVLNFLSALFFGIHILRTEQIVRSTKTTKLSALLGYEVVVVALSSAIWFILQKFFLDNSGSNLRLCTWSVLWEWIISFPGYLLCIRVYSLQVSA